MSEIAESINEAVEAARESRLNSIIALMVALIATFMALSGVKAGNLSQAMAQAQSQTVNAWSYFQAKSTKQNLAEATVAQLQTQRAIGATTLPAATLAALDSQIAKYQANVQRYEKEKNEIKATAEGYQREYESLNVHDDQFDLSDAGLSVAIALLGITALTQKRWLLVFALFFTAFGLIFGLAGFFRWDLHPEALTGLLS